MSIIKARLTTSHIDKHNEKISLGALQSMVDAINRNIIPFGIEHDPRIPPIGRILGAELISLGNGEYAIDGEIEIFDENITQLNDGRELVVRRSLDKGLELFYDRNFRGGDLKTIEDISRLLSVSPQLEFKKAVDFVSILTIVGAYAFSNIVDGLLKDLGVDPYSILKESIKKLFSSHTNPRGKLLLFDLLLNKVDGSQINAQIIVADPNDKKVEFLFNKGFSAIDKYLVREYTNPSKTLEKRVVFQIDDDSINHSFSITKDGIPIKKNIDVIC